MLLLEVDLLDAFVGGDFLEGHVFFIRARLGGLLGREWCYRGSCSLDPFSFIVIGFEAWCTISFDQAIVVL
jgi:hypothetical protein